LAKSIDESTMMFSVNFYSASMKMCFGETVKTSAIKNKVYDD